MRKRTIVTSFVVVVMGAGCGGELDAGSGVSVSRTEEGLSGCNGQASSSVPGSGDYYLTSFGAGSDSGTMSCGDNTNHGSWYYAASRQRYGCGSHIKIEANGRCVIAQTDDYGPDVCVEHAAGGPIIDASPLVAEHLFGVSSAGWSDHLRIHVTKVSSSTPLGPCAGGQGPMNNNPPPQHGSADCHSATLDKYVSSGTCVQSASDGNWYKCDNGGWSAGHSGCSASYAWCYSRTLQKYEPPRTCVQSKFDKDWYQCGEPGWVAPVHDGAGPVGTCSSEHSL